MFTLHGLTERERAGLSLDGLSVLLLCQLFLASMLASVRADCLCETLFRTAVQLEPQVSCGVHNWLAGPPPQSLTLTAARFSVWLAVLCVSTGRIYLSHCLMSSDAKEHIRDKL